jgi:hypothetical protein
LGRIGRLFNDEAAAIAAKSKSPEKAAKANENRGTGHRSFFIVSSKNTRYARKDLPSSNGAMREALYASDRNRWLHKNNISLLLLFQLHPRGSSKR